MDDIKNMHELSIEWGCITNLLDRISMLEEKMGGWPELIEMVCDAMDDMSRESDPGVVFRYVYAFLFRLYYRLRANPERVTFNEASRITIGDEEFYRIKNYSWSTFKWARDNQFDELISNNWLDLPVRKLSKSQCQAFDQRCKS